MERARRNIGTLGGGNHFIEADRSASARAASTGTSPPLTVPGA
ncbi:MAG: RtcB family protein [Synergistaceae bacterium]|nr:RtcB family protein [Synergistaceae bacterium]